MVSHLALVKPFSPDSQTTLNERMRVILVDWLMDCAEHFKLSVRTTQLAVFYLDRFLSANPQLPKDQL